MYKLYEMSTVNMVDKSNNEIDIIETIGEYLRENINLRFLIVKHEKNIDEVYRRITSINDYKNYIEDYNQRLKETGIVDLKREILDRLEEDKVKRR